MTAKKPSSSTNGEDGVITTYKNGAFWQNPTLISVAVYSFDGVIFFDGSVWKRMDPTFASSGQRSPEIMRFIENNGNYTVKYLY